MTKSSVEIGAAGEKIVNDWLRGNGNNTSLDTRQPGSTDIEAIGPHGNLLIQVKTSVNPSRPQDLLPDELRRIKARADQIKYRPYLAKVTVDEELNLVGEIEWISL